MKVVWYAAQALCRARPREFLPERGHSASHARLPLRVLTSAAPHTACAAYSLLLAAAVLAALVHPAVVSGEEAGDASAAAQRDAGPTEWLALEQQRLQEQFQRLEEMMLRMAELTAGTDPQRAALLRKAVAKSKEDFIAAQLERLAGMLQAGELAPAMERQEQVDTDLRALLELLLSEDRSRQIESERARLREYLRELNRLINRQRDVQGRSAAGGDTEGLADEQGDLSDDTGRLAEEIRRNEESARGEEGETADSEETAPGGEGAEGAGEPGEGEPGEGEPGEGEVGEGEPGESGDGQPGEGESAEAGEGGEAEPADASPQADPPTPGEPGDGEAGEQPPQSPPPPEHPARRLLQEAEERMREAQERLREAERRGAVEQQEEALRELEEARRQLEEILRQLREEEIERLLVMLEARFRKMLDMQQAVYEGTVQLDEVADADRDSSHAIEATRLSHQQVEIVVEVDRCQLLLRDDGSAVVFPEAVAEVREDMEQVAQRLARGNVGEITQSIELDVIAALEEMIDALQQAIEEQQDRQQQPPPPPGSEMIDPPLVDPLAELKMIRAMQMRINNRTERYSQLIDGGQALELELIEALRRLAERQERVYRVTRDLKRSMNER